MKTIALLFLSALLVSSCASSPVSSSKDHASADQKKYLERIRTFAHEFKVLNNSAEEMWGRAQVFVNKFSLMKIKAVSNYIIQTDDLIHVTTVADALAGTLGLDIHFLDHQERIVRLSP
jgi:outer membrane lipoprotein-sorting protein